MSLSIAIVNIIPAIGLDGCHIFFFLYKYFRIKKTYYNESGGLETFLFGKIDECIECEGMKMYKSLVWVIRVGTIGTVLLIGGSLLRDLRMGM